jgi:signal transduction histidine kinase
MTVPPMAALLPPAFLRYPGMVVVLSPAGVVLDSNGCLEREVGRTVVGTPFADVLDADSSLEKWLRVLGGADGAADGSTCELIFAGEHTLTEPRSFTVLRDGAAGTLWLLENRLDTRLDRLREEATGVNSELAGLHRDLLKERGRLAHALDELEATNRQTERLAGMVRRQNAELERSNRALDEFAHVASHDLKAPLRAISSYAEWIEEDAAGALGMEAAAHLHRLRERANRMRLMIEGLLEYARAGREQATVQQLSVGPLLQDVIELLDPPAGTVIDIPPGLPTVAAARAPLQQVFLNLVGNALKHAAPTGPVRIDIAARRADNGWEFSVADNGPGIPDALHERIWVLFHTAEPESRAVGTGIGLAVVKRVVEAHGGRAWVESNEGAGATFRFLWPDR